MLASASRYRSVLLAAASLPVEIDAPDVDERAHDARLADLGAEGLALALARMKAGDVARRHRCRIIIAADQVGVLGSHGEPERLLTKQPTPEGAVDQLLAMSGRTHRLVNGVVVVDRLGREHVGIDVQLVTMRSYGPAAARAYVERFAPLDTAGSYRIEDDEVLEGEQPGSGLVERVEGEDRSGVVGMPLPLLHRLLGEARRCETGPDAVQEGGPTWRT